MRKVLFFVLFFSLSYSLAYAGPRTAGRKAVTTAGTAERLTTTSTFCSNIILSAFPANTDVVAIGDANVIAAAATSKGLLLFPGQTEYLQVGIGGSRMDLRDTWIDSKVNSEGADYTCLN